MKPFLIFLSLLIPVFTFSQKIENYYDYRGKKTEPENARYVAIIVNTDSGWLRNEFYIREKSLKMKGVYLDSLCKTPNGQYYDFHPNQTLSSFGRYKFGKKEGLWLSYYNNGIMQDSTFFVKGKPAGTMLHWHRNLYLSDSAVWNDEGNGIKISWFDNGSPSSSGRFTDWNKKHGSWLYYHKNGLVSCREKYDKGQLVQKQYYDEGGIALQDTVSTDRYASFKSGIDDWQRYLQKNLVFPPGYKIINGDKAIVVVQAVIDEAGKVQDVEVTTPFHPSFDRLAVNVLRKSPAWIPAVEHNRKVKYRIRQSVSFMAGSK
jgi:antitoxin component YwqK of YwqJK toxin-antitoxin module